MNKLIQATQRYAERLIPIGTIVPYYGQLKALSDHWMVCDGSTVTDNDSPIKGYVLPDLRQRFLRGAQDGVSGANAGNTGGQDYVPPHNHAVSGSSRDVSFPQNSVCCWLAGYNPVTAADGLQFDASLFDIPMSAGNAEPRPSHGHIGGTATFTGTASNSGAHDNRPQYFSVPFVMRIK